MDWSPFNLFIRAFLLFVTGCFFAVVLNLLQVQNNITLFPEDETSWTYKLLYSAWWVPPSVGTGAVIIGIAYPCFDCVRLFDRTTREPIGWSSVIRCVALFVGINHASAKIVFTNNVQLSMSLAAMSFGLWWLFDRSRTGLFLGFTVAILATTVAMILVYNGVYQYKDPDFFYIRSWLPCIFFSGGVTFGSIGRQLAKENFKKLFQRSTAAAAVHEHQD